MIMENILIFVQRKNYEYCKKQCQRKCQIQKESLLLMLMEFRSRGYKMWYKINIEIISIGKENIGKFYIGKYWKNYLKYIK